MDVYWGRRWYCKNLGPEVKCYTLATCNRTDCLYEKQLVQSSFFVVKDTYTLQSGRYTVSIYTLLTSAEKCIWLTRK